jgi:lipid-A-disaccharide synthase
MRAEMQRELEWPASVVDRTADSRALPPLPARPLRVFVAAAEPSGERHAHSLLNALRAQLAQAGRPAPICTGIGGALLESAGVELIARPVERASMGFRGPLANLSYYAGVLRASAAHFARDRTDVVVAVDSPALHVPLGRVAHRYGVPFVHFITPQYWGWAPWRAPAYPRAVDRALTILPFESAWFARRGIDVAYVGHPALDALAGIEATRPREDAGSLVLLPGSRISVIERNLPWMLRTAERLRAAIPALMVVIAHADKECASRLHDIVLAEHAESWARVETGDLHGTLSRARAALSVSGTILIDLLHHRLPSVVIYRLSNRFSAWLGPRLLSVPWFASVNLLAAREVYPEFSFSGEGPRARILRALELCYGDSAWRAECMRGLDLAHERLGPPGAADRAAGEVLDLVRAHARRGA